MGALKESEKAKKRGCKSCTRKRRGGRGGRSRKHRIVWLHGSRNGLGHCTWRCLKLRPAQQQKGQSESQERSSRTLLDEAQGCLNKHDFVKVSSTITQSEWVLHHGVLIRIPHRSFKSGTIASDNVIVSVMF